MKRKDFIEAILKGVFIAIMCYLLLLVVIQGFMCSMWLYDFTFDDIFQMLLLRFKVC